MVEAYDRVADKFREPDFESGEQTEGWSQPVFETNKPLVSIVSAGTPVAEKIHSSLTPVGKMEPTRTPTWKHSRRPLRRDSMKPVWFTLLYLSIPPFAAALGMFMIWLFTLLVVRMF